MKQLLLLLLIFFFNSSFGQVDNYDLLTKNIESSSIKSNTKYRKAKKFPNGEKEFKLEFNRQGQLVAVEEYRYHMSPDNPIVMRQEIKYDLEGKKILAHHKAPDGSAAVDTFIYNEQDELIKKQRIVDGEIIRTWKYNDDVEDDVNKEFDVKGNLVRLSESDDEFTIYKYDSIGNLIQELQYQEGKEHTKYTFQYDKNNRLTDMKAYLLYIGDGTTDPLIYYFEYEEFE